MPVHMAEGGEAKKEEEDKKVDPAPVFSQPMGMMDAPVAPSGVPAATEGVPIADPNVAQIPAPDDEELIATSPQVAAPTLMPTGAAPAATPVAAPTATTTPLLENAIKEKTAALGIEQKEMSKLAQTQQKVLELSLKDQEEYNKDVLQKSQNITTELNAAVQDVKNGHIDPKAFWANKSTPGKISTVIGVLLSGLGAGASGQENMAMKVLNQEIDRDIDAQKSNMQNKNTLVGALSAQMGNLQAGVTMAKAIKLGVVSDQMKLAEAKANDPLAKARMRSGIADLDMKVQELTTKAAAATAKGVRTPAQQHVDAAFAKDYNDWQTTGQSSVQKNLQLLTNAVDTLEKRKKDIVGTSGRVTGRLPDAFRSEESIRVRDDVHRAVQGALRATLGSQFTEREGERIMAASYNENLSPEANIKKIKGAIQELQHNVSNMDARSSYYEQHGTLTGWVSPKGTGVEDSGARRKANLEWAQANPKDPRAIAYLEAHKKLSGGQ